MAKNPNWSIEEIALLKQSYPKLGTDPEIEKLFPGRNARAIGLKASRLGIKVEHNIREERTHEKYLELLNLTNFVVLEEYKGSTIPIMHMCSLCDHEWRVRPQHCLRPGAMCPICSRANRLNTQKEVDNILERAGLARLSEYTGALDPLTIRHKYCGYEWTSVYSYIQQGSGCPLCNNGFGYGMAKESMPESATLYLIKIVTDTEEYLKVGVTTRDIGRRVSEIKRVIPNIRTIEVLHTISSTGISILKTEQIILSSSKRYFTQAKFAGCTELLSQENDIKLIMEKMNGSVL